MAPISNAKSSVLLHGGRHDGKIMRVPKPAPKAIQREGHDYTRDISLDRGDIFGYRWVPRNPGVMPYVPRGTE